MTQQNKTIARLALQGIGLLGIVVGVGFMSILVAAVFSLERESFARFWGQLIVVGGLLLLGTGYVRDSYGMLRGRAFGAIRTAAVFLALLVFGLLQPWVEPLGIVPADGSMGRFAGDLVGVVILLSFVLVYSLFLMFLRRLVVLAYGPEGLTGTYWWFGGPPSGG